MSDDIGERFARSIAAKDRSQLIDLLDPQLDFRAMTPKRVWEAGSAEELVDDVILGTWFGPTDHIDALEDVSVGSVADRSRVSYRFGITNADGKHVVEQQAYFDVADGCINWLRIMCSGYRSTS